MLFSLAETSFSAAQNRSKRKGGVTASNAINAATAANVLMVASAFKMTSFGQPIAQENKQLHSSPRRRMQQQDHLPPSAQGAVVALTLTLKDSGKAAFQGALQVWFWQHEGFLNERLMRKPAVRTTPTRR